MSGIYYFQVLWGINTSILGDVLSKADNNVILAIISTHSNPNKKQF